MVKCVKLRTFPHPSLSRRCDAYRRRNVRPPALSITFNDEGAATTFEGPMKKNCSRERGELAPSGVELPDGYSTKRERDWISSRVWKVDEKKRTEVLGTNALVFTRGRCPQNCSFKRDNSCWAYATWAFIVPICLSNGAISSPNRTVSS